MVEQKNANSLQSMLNNMKIKFIHTADIHLGKTYRNSPGEIERYEDFFRCLSVIIEDALREKVDFLLICGDLFHEGRIMSGLLQKPYSNLFFRR